MIRRLYAVWVYANDLAESRKFYEEALGLKFRLQSADGQWIEFDAGDTSFAILQRPQEKGPLKPQKTRIMFEVEDMEGTKNVLERRGVKFVGDVRREEYGALLTFEDPNGHWLELFEPNYGQQDD